jgi:hypothetical protein
MTMTLEEQTIELVNPEINKIKVGVGIGLILVSLILLILSFSFSEYTQSIELILEFSTYFLSAFGGIMIGLGIGHRFSANIGSNGSLKRLLFFG